MDNHALITCDARIENEALVRCMVGMFVAPLNPTLDEITEIKTILSEAVANAVIHGYENNTNGQINVEFILMDHQLEIIVSDEGCGIENIQQACEPLYTTKPELERSGMGMTIMESLSDHFEIHSVLNQGTTVKMIKNLRGNK